MNENLKKCAALGQSIWWDSISSKMIAQGTLEELIRQGIRGVTTNPAIFQKAIAHSSDYDGPIRALAAQGASDQEIYDSLTTGDVAAAADLFRPLWESTGGLDGYVSLEVSPLIASDQAATVAEAARLWQKLQRPNCMIKIPATAQSLPAIEEATARGINVNATLIFSLDQHKAVAQAYMAGLERRAQAGQDISQVASVASVFVSRIDTALDARLAEGGAEPLMGHTAVDNARLVYQQFKELFSGPRWQALADRGAKVQRPLWASTGVKNPAYLPLLYVESLIGPQTVNTLPPATLELFMKAGAPAARLEEGLQWARNRRGRLAELGIDLESETGGLLEQGLKAFQDSFRDLMAAIAEKREPKS